jgi:hypothetical protein
MTSDMTRELQSNAGGSYILYTSRQRLARLFGPRRFVCTLFRVSRQLRQHLQVPATHGRRHVTHHTLRPDDILRKFISFHEEISQVKS